MEHKYTFKQHLHLLWRGYKVLNTFPRPALLSAVMAAFCGALVPFVNIYFSAQILNELAGMRSQERLTTLVIYTIGFNLCAVLLHRALTRWADYCGAYNANIAYKVYSDKMLRMDFSDAEDTKIRNEYAQLHENQNGQRFGLLRLIQFTPAAVKGLMQVLVSAAMAFTLFLSKVPEGSPYAWLDSVYALAGVLAVLVGLMFIAPFITTRGSRIFATMVIRNNKKNRFFWFYLSQMTEGSKAAKDIRIYNQNKLIFKDIDREYDEIFGKSGMFRQVNNYYCKYSNTAMVISQLCGGLIFLYIAMKALAGAFGVGHIVLYVGAVSQFCTGFADILQNIGQLRNNNPFLAQLFNFLDIPSKQYQGRLTTEKRSDCKYEIEFRNVSFKYPSSDEYALRDVSLKFDVGQRLAIVGQNGSGKTTFIKLLCRLYDPTEGEILLNGFDIRKYRPDEYMSIFSIVFQDFCLLPFTLGQNVAVGTSYDEPHIKKVLAQAGFGERLNTLSQGLDTCIDKYFEEDGVELSGGEQQKTALARALNKEAPFIVLDEPTAALDPMAEFEVYSRMNEIVGDKTAVFISHRLSSCRFCSDIAVFHEGRLVQRGSHDALAADESGKYYELWNAQAQYYMD
jgi:ATP-binding cassette subfamily B protein